MIYCSLHSYSYCYIIFIDNNHHYVQSVCTCVRGVSFVKALYYKGDKRSMIVNIRLIREMHQ